MIDKLKFHHVGIIVDNISKKQLEKTFRSKFIMDPIQETSVLFIKDQGQKIYIEYILKEGRVKHSKLGVAHYCYSVNDLAELKIFESYIKNKKLGFSVTKLEKSIAKECNYVKFFYLKNYSLIEINVENISV
tara:strand:+ start:4082 stop:4477 length:396 start_codon:yes stop_codon:yes gene_type:complete